MIKEFCRRSWTIKVKEEKFKTFIVLNQEFQKITNFLTKKQNEINIEQKDWCISWTRKYYIFKNNEYLTSKNLQWFQKWLWIKQAKSNELAGLELNISKSRPMPMEN
ncbi:hypothetical protein [Metamycoplasma hominis]|uniref:hypothetical protein n=1 Tax=Metamycoplasma hominis TaxID=2098 RepID=UPI001E4EAAC2|nr:hypothetical protein [Metamycoplasma hominis]